MKRAVVVLLLLIANALVSLSKESAEDRARLKIKVAQVFRLNHSLGCEAREDAKL